VEYVQEIIKRLHVIPEKTSLYLENWPWPLKIYTLGRFELLKDGNPVQFSRKAQQKPLALLKVLIAFGGKEVREDQIEDALWPEADGDSAHHSFEMTLHRLRTLIGQPETLEFQEGRLSLDPRYHWVDVWAFEHLFEEADHKRKEGLTERSVELTQKAMEMYRGPFLAGEIEQPWVISIRERLRRKFLRNVSWVGRYWEQCNQWEKTLECYERGLEVDDLAEELYQRLMVCYQRLGRKAEALSVYNRCKKTLSAALGVPPSSETVALYKSLLTDAS
jgi:DNA-binding SARP family transcriptional activator